ncbi:MAG TPA: hypothetical protein VMG08_06275 [Allosphingosinicella sp.]|nr:hypothetical protein [Allosphingosinicella sp.]
MIARGFRPVVWVFMIGAAVLGCYMLNLRVAAERAELAKLDRRIISTQQSIRTLQTEVGTRSRIPQLEEWNNDVLALAAPASGQYLQQNVSLARFDARQPQVSDQAEVRMASAETGEAARSGEAPSATPAPQRAVAAPSAAARPEVRRASLSIPAATPAPRPRDAGAPARREPERVIRAAARDEVRPGPREERVRTASRDERARPVAREERRPAPVRTAARTETRPGPARPAARDERRPVSARPTTRAAAAPVRAPAGRVLANQRPARELRKDERPQRRGSNRD